MLLVEFKKHEIVFSGMLIILILTIISCSYKKEEPKEIILAKIADRTISLSEFEQRAEHTIRPVYCRGDNNLHKKIILNSLIAEKMLALEAGNDNDFVKDKNFQNHILGRQEQAMREWLLHEEGFEKVQIKDAEIEKILEYSGLTYKIQYYNIPNEYVSDDLKQESVDESEKFEKLHQQFWLEDDIAQREVKWNTHDHQAIMDALFNEKIKKGSVIGPLNVDGDSHLMIKVLGWTDQPVISENARKDKRHAIREDLTKKRAMQQYEKFVGSIMIGKKLEFDPNTFKNVVNLIKPFYRKSAKEKQELFLDAAFDRRGENPDLNNLADGIEGILDNPFFRVEGKVWSVRNFKDELQRHPLVFRRDVPKETSFAEQFKFAVIDLIRDSYLTSEAYKRGYDKINIIKRNRQMWYDSFVAQYQQNEYLKSIISTPLDSLNTIRIIEDHLNSYIDQLQGKYSDKIMVNVEEFNNIKLTRIDMIVLQQNAPFPVVVPGFPQVTTDNRLDYGLPMK